MRRRLFARLGTARDPITGHGSVDSDPYPVPRCPVPASRHGSPGPWCTLIGYGPRPLPCLISVILTIILLDNLSRSFYYSFPTSHQLPITSYERFDSISTSSGCHIVTLSHIITKSSRDHTVTPTCQKLGICPTVLLRYSHARTPIVSRMRLTTSRGRSACRRPTRPLAFTTL